MGGFLTIVENQIDHIEPITMYSNIAINQSELTAKSQNCCRARESLATDAKVGKTLQTNQPQFTIGFSLSYLSVNLISTMVVFWLFQEWPINL